MVGRILSHYRLLERIGHGGMASVFRARDLKLERDCALKLLHPHLQANEESRVRFQREAQAVARLHHENILEIYEHHLDDENSFLVTELIEGPSLRTHLQDHLPQFPEIAALLGAELSRALSVAHGQGIIHRDVKPENVLIRRGGTVALCDFGIARVLDKETMTSTGQLLGSPAYMAPEHIKGLPVDARCDLFALGVLMYEAVAGQLPFQGKNPHDMLVRIAAGAHEPIAALQPIIGSELSTTIEQCLANDPADRPTDASALHDALCRALLASGITDPRAELRAYFASPAAWEMAFSARLVHHLVQTGKALHAEQRTAKALALWSRAQQIDPGHAEVQALLNSVSRHGRRRRTLRQGAALLGTLAGLGLLAIGGRSVWQRTHRQHIPNADQATPAQAITPLLPAPVPVVPVDTVPPRVLALPLPASLSAVPPAPAGALPAGPPIADHLPHPRSRPPEAAPLRTVRLEPWPKAVRVTHNQRFLGMYGTDVRTVQLLPGRNEFLFENPACYSERVLLPPGTVPPEIRVRLRWKPALLQVRALKSSEGDASPSELAADILIDGKLVGRSGQVVALALTSDEGSRQVDLQVTARGHRSASRTVTVRANQLLPLDILLRPL